MSKSLFAGQRLLAGFNTGYDTWRRPERLESKETAAKGEDTLTLAEMAQLLYRAKIKRIVGTLEEGRMGGSRLPDFDLEAIETLMAEAVRSPSHKELAIHHWKARMASSAASEVDKARDSQASHKMHAAAAKFHQIASQHMAAGGDQHHANVHAQWAAHHEKIAAHHASTMMHGNNTAHAQQPAQSSEPVFKSKKAVEPPRVEKPKTKHPAAPADATVHWQPGMGKVSPTKPVKTSDDVPGYEGVPKETQKHVAQAHKSTHVASTLSRMANAKIGDEAQRSASQKGIAVAHKKAAHDHLHAALSLFHSGHHDKALTHFNAAIHNMSKHQEVMSDKAAQGRASARKADPVGPRAAVGRVSVPSR